MFHGQGRGWRLARSEKAVTRFPYDLLTRRYPCGLPGPFRTVRDLGRVLVGCSWKSGWRPLLRFSEFGALPLWTRSLIPRMAKIIPRIFQIMDASAVTARTLQGMARVRSGQAPAWPLVSGRSVRSGLQGQA